MTLNNQVKGLKKKKKIAELRKEFLGIFDGLPEGEKRMPITVVGGEPASWRVVRVEVEGKTKMGRQMLRRMEQLKIL